MSDWEFGWGGTAAISQRWRPVSWSQYGQKPHVEEKALWVVDVSTFSDGS